MRVVLFLSGGWSKSAARKTSSNSKQLEADGWILIKVKGSHHHFKHHAKPGKVTVKHPQKDVPEGTRQNILRQAGLK
ncbi:MAG TPA: type II toxin-antitoxin system HicA family toxin [Synergistaceae bacterium]|nr:type II toxin-antitoxin system HicA family toxin [Synergistaceae bacterium]HQK25683.1 type II toxin-antitoxin system HicA family toxin [Synergistaceae bacterium]